MCLEHSGQGQGQLKMKLVGQAGTDPIGSEGPGEAFSSYSTWDGEPFMCLSRSIRYSDLMRVEKVLF